MRYAARNATILAAFQAAYSSGHVNYNEIGMAVEPPVKDQQVKLILKQCGVTNLPSATIGRPRNKVITLSDLHEQIGNLIFQYCLAEEVSDEQLFEATSIPVRIIEKIKLGVHNITLSELQALSSAMKISLVQLIEEGV